MGVATLSDLIGSLLSPENVSALAAMTMTKIASTVCETLNMSHVIFHNSAIHACTHTHVHRVTYILFCSYTGGGDFCFIISLMKAVFNFEVFGLVA